MHPVNSLSDFFS